MNWHTEKHKRDREPNDTNKHKKKHARTKHTFGTWDRDHHAFFIHDVEPRAHTLRHLHQLTLVPTTNKQTLETMWALVIQREKRGRKKERERGPHTQIHPFIHTHTFTDIHPNTPCFQNVQASGCTDNDVQTWVAIGRNPLPAGCTQNLHESLYESWCHALWMTLWMIACEHEERNACMFKW